MNKTKKNIKISFSFIMKLAKTIILALTLFCILLIILYSVGNYQNFQDKNQQLILMTISYVSICNIFFTIPIIVENFIRLFTAKKKGESIRTILLMFLVIIVMICCISFSSVLEFLSKGF